MVNTGGIFADMENEEPAKPIAARVAANVRELRKARGLDLNATSDRMGALGRPLSLSGLSKVERGQRGVDVDDLVALAAVLNVSPLRLLLTPDASDDRISLTPKVSVPKRDAWQWASGEHQLGLTGELEEVDTSRRGGDVDDALRRAEEFSNENRPHVEADDWTSKQYGEHESVLGPVADAATAANDAGVPWPAIHGYLHLTKNLRARLMARGVRVLEGGDHGIR